MLRYYQLLGLSNNASLDEIKRAYRRKSMKYHPDRNPSPDATRQFIEMSTAYQALVKYKTSGYTPVYTAPPVYTPPQPKQYKNTRFTEEQMREAREKARRERAKKSNNSFGIDNIIWNYIVKGFVTIFFSAFLLLFATISVVCLSFGFQGHTALFIVSLFPIGFSIYCVKILQSIYFPKKKKKRPVKKKRPQKRR